MSQNEDGEKAPLASPLRIGQVTIPWWLRAIVLAGSVLMIVGALLALFRPAMLVSPHDEINGAVHIYAAYLASRNLALGLLLLVALSLRALSALNSLMLLYASIQLLDAAIDCAEGRWAIVPVVLLLGVAFLLGSFRISGHPFWRIKAWKG